MAVYGVLIERDADGYTAWVPVIPGAHGFGDTKAEAVQHLAEGLKRLLEAEPAGLADLDEQRQALEVEAHLVEITQARRPRIREQKPAGLSDLARELRVTRQTVWNWTGRYADFPIPVAHTAAGPLWPAQEVKRWAASRGKDGRYRKRQRV